MPAVIPVADNPHQSMNVVLGGQSVHMIIRWLPTDARWHLSVRRRTGESILEGIRMVTGVNLAHAAREGFRGIISVEGPGDAGRAAWREGTHILRYDPDL